MKTLIVEDDFTSRLLMQELLKSYGQSHVAVNGQEAVEAVRIALAVGEPYDLICLDIMMPQMDGLEALREIRSMEEALGISGADRVHIIMTTAVSDKASVIKALEQHSNYYLVKPVQKAKLLEVLHNLKLIS